MKAFIYLITNLLNGKMYIGKSINPEERWMIHKKVANGGKEKYPNDFFAIHGSIAKHNENNFKFEVIEEFDSEEEAYYFERWWIEFLETHRRNIGYNLNYGGLGSYSPSEKTRLKQSIKSRGDNSATAKLTEKQVIELLNKWGTGEYTQRKLAKEYGIHFGTVNDILVGKIWKHIPRPFNNYKEVYSVEQKHKLFVRSGERAGNSKLKENDVIDILKLYGTGQYTQNKLAKRYGITRETISKIIRNKNWKHIKR